MWSRPSSSGFTGSEVDVRLACDVVLEEELVDVEEECLLDHALSRVDDIITQVTDRLVDSPVSDDIGDGNAWCTRVAPRHAQTGHRRHRSNVRSQRNLAREAHIAEILAAGQPFSEMRAYVARRNFCRVPACLRHVSAQLDAEQQYMGSLQEPREACKTAVRLLTQKERQELSLEMGQRFQHLRAQGSQYRDELTNAKKDLELMRQPYVFVEA